MATRETELQKLLADERMRSEQHKMNYQTLKAEHKKLQDDYSHFQEQLAHVLDERQHEKDENSAMMKTNLVELERAKALIVELRAQVLTPQRLEMLRLKHEEEFQKQCSETIAKLTAENDEQRNEFNSLRYEYSLVRNAFEQEKLELERKLEEIKLRYDNEIVHLRKQNESLLNEKVKDQDKDIETIKSLQKENQQLQIHVQDVVRELKDKEQNWKQIANQTVDEQREQKRQMAEMSASIRALEIEKTSGQELCKDLQKKLNESYEGLSALKSQLAESDIEANRLRLQVEDAERRAKLEIATSRSELAKQKMEARQENDHLLQQVKRLTAEVQSGEQDSRKHVQLLIDKEKEMTNHLQRFQQEEWEKQNKLKAEISQLEARNQELAKRLTEMNENKYEAVHKVEEKCAGIVELKSNLEKEVLVLRTKLDQYQKAQRELESLRLENRELQLQISKLRATLHATGDVEDQLVSKNKELNIALENARREIETCQDKKDRSASEMEKALHRQEMRFEQEKLETVRQISKLEREVKDFKQRLSSSTKSYKYKVSKYTRLIVKLRNRLELQNAKLQELTIEKEALKNFVPHETHNRVKKQLHDLQQRHEEFRKLLQAQAIIGSYNVEKSPSLYPLDLASSVWVFAAQDSQQLETMKIFQEHLKQLQEKQRSQLDDLMVLKGKTGAIL